MMAIPKLGVATSYRRAASYKRSRGIERNSEKAAVDRSGWRMGETLALAGQGALYADCVNLQWVRLFGLLHLNLNFAILMDSLC
jgi:hypothetical protein